MKYISKLENKIIVQDILHLERIQYNWKWINSVTYFMINKKIIIIYKLAKGLTKKQNFLVASDLLWNNMFRLNHINKFVSMLMLKFFNSKKYNQNYFLLQVGLNLCELLAFWGFFCWLLLLSWPFLNCLSWKTRNQSCLPV